MTVPSRTGSLPGALVISLDFELRWGVRDRHPRGSRYERKLLGAREAVPRMLALFEEHGVAATWATVGFLFARSRAELEDASPSVRPRYADPRLDPYAERTGEGESDDPLHFAASLLERVRSTARQEIATHTFSHYYCGEPGQSADAFRADLRAAREMAARRGIELRSIVFPRNQHNPAYDSILLEEGITAYRGNPPAWMWRFGDAAEGGSPLKRGARLLDAYLPVAGSGGVRWADVRRPDGLADVRASCFLRPYSPALRHLEPLRVARLRGALRAAARRREIFHLWWHPHNFGANTEENLAVLRSVLREFDRCRDRHAMTSLTMGEVADRAPDGGGGRRAAGRDEAMAAGHV